MKTTILIIGLCVAIARDGATRTNEISASSMPLNPIRIAKDGVAPTNNVAPVSTNISTKAQSTKGYQGERLLIQTNQVVAPNDTGASIKRFPTVAKPKPSAMIKGITTRDGKVYKNVTVEKVDPSGLTVTYSMARGGLGIAKIPFGQLSPELQTEYGYDPQAAAKYQSAEKQAAAQWGAKMAADEQESKIIWAERERQEEEAAKEAKRAADEERKIRAAELAAAAAAYQATNPPPPPVINVNQQVGY